MKWNDKNWSNVIFSDEKKFNLDGPNESQYYWHDLRMEDQIFSKRLFGGWPLMIWGAFSINGKASLVKMKGRQNGQKYTEVHPQHRIFQQDNAVIHTGKLASKWLQDNFIGTLSWPAKSPDLNPIENLWGILSRKVYDNGKEYDDKAQVWTAIKDCWKDISISVLCKLINSMSNRCVDVLSSRVNTCKY